ncbi:PAS domain-containing protein [Oceanibacterium hippocampi]|uniref:PAS domain protein n=1 Tax=Oceanibacterium hippocampi TaxID=745714 RepID=A0A1Y5TXK3_9PROT|nr:PAS domain-containing protein [Oceanibacterium hippocampi]SLN76243.1 PAS domain protein [Oceanibacterium hippocampi]
MSRPTSLLAADIETASPDQLAIRKYWSERKDGDRLPGRQHIRPEDIPDLLPRISLVDVVPGPAGRRFRSRLIGTELVHRFGRNITGKFGDELYTPEYLEQLNATYNGIIEAREARLFRCSTMTANNYLLRYSRIIMPLARDGMTVDMLLVLFEFEGDRMHWDAHCDEGRSHWQAPRR